mmetsp:Transcript_8131/g.15514  ORF Transcript_8131/g.15514 Transcript_8131/m.15514 type:complete len:122 (-) Transcript_8131:20-385(-)
MVREQNFPPESVFVMSFPARRGIANHSYRDYSKVPTPAGFVAPTNVDEMTFPQKVHAMLSNPAFEHCISWMPHGRAFKILLPAAFEQLACPRFFGHGRYSSFLRELNNYGFKHLTKRNDRN